MSRKPQEDGATIRGIPTVPKPSEVRLTEKQQLSYHHHRQNLLKWCLSVGKDPDKAEPYSEDTIRVRAGHIDRFYRWCWDQRGGYTTDVDHEDADEYMQHLAFREDLSNSTASKYQKSLKMLFRWRSRKLGDEEWEPEITFSSSNNATQPRDYFSMDERRKLREAVLELGDEIPHYKSVSGERRKRIKKLLAVRLAKPLNEISKQDWEEERSWKYPSMIYTALDAGLRPVEVGRARTEWVDVDNSVLRIPKGQSSKNRENWVVALTNETTDMLDRWLTERNSYPKYDDSDRLWLTRRRNPYSSSSCNGLLERVLEEADMDTDRTWYAIRHSTGTYMSREGGLAAAQSQLRHLSSRTTLKYDQTPPEDRRDALDKMG